MLKAGLDWMHARVMEVTEVQILLLTSSTSEKRSPSGWVGSQRTPMQAPTKQFLAAPSAGHPMVLRTYP